jgi:signal transduction histidine kinase
MPTASLADPHRGDAGTRPRRRTRGFPEFGRAGLAVVAATSLVDAIRQTIRFIVTRPFADWIGDFLLSYAFTFFIGCAIVLAVAFVVDRVPERGLRQYAGVCIAVLLATAAALAMFTTFESLVLAGPDEPPYASIDFAMSFVPDWLRYSLLGLLVAGAWLYARAEDAHSTTLAQIAVDTARADQQTAEARLQVLEAQIEPHFLFNTLAHVRRLYETNYADGARMLRNLKEYLAVALPQMREKASTLGREIDHVIAYLNIQQIRMGPRLRFAIDVPQALRDAAMPPLMLLTLAENAVKHGLSPSREGGRIDLRAVADGGYLRVDVADTGAGFSKSAGTGTGLANIRARLKASFGDAASLSLASNAPRGIVATITLPLRPEPSRRDPG